ncbi:GNAT family N-acetyltransferase [Azospirillum griseum]|uniref:GNAT family N-acetyltransferase n=1 Tax=Azospirillum griseum TaxID=2496639 RepID=A0A431VCD5_9PROT|nr:GNAT family N-acetyltransferase [Azospirillum griseum]RTR16147.1 GNAT family N-acetyltransferase [Azospirillum griseum]
MTDSHAADSPSAPRLWGAEARAVAGVRLKTLSADLPADLTTRVLTPDDADRLHVFRLSVVSSLADPDHYRMAGEVGNFVADHLGDKGLTAGIFRGDRLVAYGAIGLPGPGDANRGRDLGLPEEELALVAHMSSAMVEAPDRGRGLHHRLIAWRLEVARALGRPHLLTTVSPRNHVSWGHLAQHGLYPRRWLQVDKDLVRFLVHRDVRVEPVLDTTTARLVPLERLSGQTDLFAQGGRVWARLSGGDVPGGAAGAERRWYALCGRERIGPDR